MRSECSFGTASVPAMDARVPHADRTAQLAFRAAIRRDPRGFGRACPWTPLPNGRMELAHGAVHLWRVDASAHTSATATLAQTLAPEEVERAARFRRPIDRQRYVIAHGALRNILARYVNDEPRRVVLRSVAGGKPELANSSLHFNMSRSRDLVVVAISATHPAGVDVEQVRPGVAREVTRCFSPKAFELLQALPERARRRAFFQGWTRMEAYAKARGDGLTRHIDALEAFLCASGEAPATPRDDERGERRWWLYDLTPRRHYVGTLAAPRGSTLVFWKWSH